MPLPRFITNNPGKEYLPLDEKSIEEGSGLYIRQQSSRFQKYGKPTLLAIALCLVLFFLPSMGQWALHRPIHHETPPPIIDTSLTAWKWNLTTYDESKPTCKGNKEVLAGDSGTGCNPFKNFASGLDFFGGDGYTVGLFQDRSCSTKVGQYSNATYLCVPGYEARFFKVWYGLL